MKFYYSSRVKIGTILIILFSLASGVRFIKKEINFTNLIKPIDAITLNEKRYEELKPYLLRRGIVGYMSDVHSIKEYYLTQYTLAPVIVVKTKDYPLIIGNYQGTIAGPENFKNGDLFLLRDFGNGVSLLRGKNK
jgi:hypothetical protein